MHQVLVHYDRVLQQAQCLGLVLLEHWARLDTSAALFVGVSIAVRSTTLLYSADMSLVMYFSARLTNSKQSRPTPGSNGNIVK